MYQLVTTRSSLINHSERALSQAQGVQGPGGTGVSWVHFPGLAELSDAQGCSTGAELRGLKG